MRIADHPSRLLKSRIVPALAILLVVFTMLGWQTDTRARYTKLGHEMMCMCGCNQILLECNHVGCTVSDKMAKQLQARLDQGMTDEQIKQAFIQEYGIVVLAAPTNKGFDLVAWIMPFVALVLSVGAVAWVVRTWKRRPQAATAAAQAGDAPELDALRKRAREETEF